METYIDIWSTSDDWTCFTLIVRLSVDIQSGDCLLVDFALLWLLVVNKREAVLLVLTHEQAFEQVSRGRLRLMADRRRRDQHIKLGPTAVANGIITKPNELKGETLNDRNIYLRLYSHRLTSTSGSDVTAASRQQVTTNRETRQAIDAALVDCWALRKCDQSIYACWPRVLELWVMRRYRLMWCDLL